MTLCRPGFTAGTGALSVIASAPRVNARSPSHSDKRAGSKSSTPRPGSNFPGLQPGDKWCLCATRWLEAFHAGLAPPVVLEATHSKALEMITLAQLQDN